MNILYEQGKNQIEQEFNIVKIIKQLRNLTILLEYEQLRKDIKHRIEHDFQNIIYIDDEFQKSEAESSAKKNRWSKIRQGIFKKIRMSPSKSPLKKEFTNINNTDNTVNVLTQNIQ